MIGDEEEEEAVEENAAVEEAVVKTEDAAIEAIETAEMNKNVEYREVDAEEEVVVGGTIINRMKKMVNIVEEEAVEVVEAVAEAAEKKEAEEAVAEVAAEANIRLPTMRTMTQLMLDRKNRNSRQRLSRTDKLMKKWIMMSKKAKRTSKQLRLLKTKISKSEMIKLLTTA